MKPCRGFDPGSNPGRGATNSRLPTSFLLAEFLLWIPWVETLHASNNILILHTSLHYNHQ